MGNLVITDKGKITEFRRLDSVDDLTYRVLGPYDGPARCTKGGMAEIELNCQTGNAENPENLLRGSYSERVYHSLMCAMSSDEPFQTTAPSIHEGITCIIEANVPSPFLDVQEKSSDERAA